MQLQASEHARVLTRPTTTAMGAVGARSARHGGRDEVHGGGVIVAVQDDGHGRPPFRAAASSAFPFFTNSASYRGPARARASA